MEAVWGQDYDYHTDSLYKRPMCPNCQAPIGKDDDNKYHCFSCGEAVEVTDLEMIEWFKIREETRVEIGECKQWKSKDGTVFGCGGKGCYKTLYVRNKVTLEWQAACGGCEKCGIKFIV